VEGGQQAQREEATLVRGKTLRVVQMESTVWTGLGLEGQRCRRLTAHPVRPDGKRHRKNEAKDAGQEVTAMA
jgi:hypothetical protein